MPKMKTQKQLEVETKIRQRWKYPRDQTAGMACGVSGAVYCRLERPEYSGEEGQVGCSGRAQVEGFRIHGAMAHGKECDKILTSCIPLPYTAVNLFS